MSRKDGLCPAIWFECQSPDHDDLISDIPESEIWTLALFHRYGEHMTQAEAIKEARARGWRLRKGTWICPLCLEDDYE